MFIVLVFSAINSNNSKRKFFSSNFKIPAAIMNVLEEYVVKMKNQTSRKGINLVYFLFWTSLYQLICVGSLFWLDILPWYGNVDTISEFGRKYVILSNYVLK